MGSDSVGDPRHIDVGGPSECAIVTITHWIGGYKRLQTKFTNATGTAARAEWDEACDLSTETLEAKLFDLAHDGCWGASPPVLLCSCGSCWP